MRTDLEAEWELGAEIRPLEIQLHRSNEAYILRSGSDTDLGGRQG